MEKKLPKKLYEKVVAAQRSELTEHYIYKKIAEKTKDSENRHVLEKLASEELLQYEDWKKISGIDVKPDIFRINTYLFLAKYLGLNFSIRLLENKEKSTKAFYKDLENLGERDILEIIEKEDRFEDQIFKFINKDELAYASSVVLGLNDALVELTGALAGFTFALQDHRLIAIAGFIVGVAAAFSMASAEYLSVKEEGQKSPIRASLVTGITYLVTVLMLIIPYFLFTNPLVSLVIMLSVALFIILVFNFYISVAKDTPFRKRVIEMIVISLSVAVINFLIGIIARKLFGLEV